MNKIILGAGLGAGIMVAAATAQAASCTEAARSLEHSVRAGQSIDPALSRMMTPNPDGARATSDTAAVIANAGRSPEMAEADTTAQPTANALEALAQARIYGGIGQSDACLVALHEGLRLLDQS